jgi:hypothetical protein
MRYIQHSCREDSRLDLRQAQAVLRHRPDAILFEAPMDKPSVSLLYNKFAPKNKPLKLVHQYQAMLRKVSKTYPWVASDIVVYDNIVRLWRDGHEVKLYNMDGPSDLLHETIRHGWNMTSRPRRRGVHFLWWVYIYLRERAMADNLADVTTKLPPDAVVLVFLEKFHWLHVQFLLDKPSRKEIFDYYFKAFEDTPHALSVRVHACGNKSLVKYWSEYSDFA